MPAYSRNTDKLAATLKANGRTLPSATTPYDRSRAEELRQAQYRAGQQYTGALRLAAGNSGAVAAKLDEMKADWQAAKADFTSYMDRHEPAAA